MGGNNKGNGMGRPAWETKGEGVKKGVKKRRKRGNKG